jgi:hypothetical protein
MGRRFACGILRFSVGDLRNRSELNFAKGFIKGGLFGIESKLEFKVSRRFSAVMIREDVTELCGQEVCYSRRQ